MRTFWLLFPAGLSAIVLGAHFLRRGQGPVMLLCLGLVFLLSVRRPWASRVVRGALFVGMAEWLRTLVTFVAARRMGGEPWFRLAVILGAVSAVTLGAALLLGTARARRHFAGARDPDPRVPGPPDPGSSPDPSSATPRLE